MERTTTVTQATPGELLELTAGLRKLGAAGFRYGEFEVTFYEPLPLEMQDDIKNDGITRHDDDEEDETPAERVKRLRRQQLDADIHGSS